MSTQPQEQSASEISRTIPKHEPRSIKRKGRTKNYAVSLPTISRTSDNKGHNCVEVRHTKPRPSDKRELPGNPKVNRSVRNSYSLFSHASGKHQDYLTNDKYTGNIVAPITLTRKDILQNKILCSKLAARLAEAKQTLADLDSLENEPVASGAQNTSGGSNSGQSSSRVTFQAVGKKVTNIIRFRQAALTRHASGASTSEVYDRLPKTPRFSSYLSAAAQYALMKGYEDIIYEKLSASYPEYSGQLKRNKTPHHGVAISQTSKFELLKSVNQDSYNSTSLNPDKAREMSPRSDDWDLDNEIERVEKNVEVHQFTKKAIKIFGSSINGETNSTNESQNFLKSFPTLTSNYKNLNKTSPSLSKSSSNNNDKVENLQENRINNANVAWNLQKSDGISRLTPVHRDRRILLTHRMENAMDILDALMTTSEHALSPRIKLRHRGRVVLLADFNRWTDQWATEFNNGAVK